MEIQKRQRVTDRNRIEPQGQLRQFDRHWVQVNPENASFDDPPLPVGQGRFVAESGIQLRIPGVRVSSDFLRKVLARAHQEMA